MTERGLLNLLDEVDRLLSDVDFGGILTPDKETRSALRREAIRVRNARLTVQEVRRRIERAGQETP